MEDQKTLFDWEGYVAHVVQWGASPLLRTLDLCTSLSSKDVEGAKQALAQGWDIKKQEFDLGWSGLYAMLGDKKIPDHPFYWPLIPMTHIIGDFLVKLGQQGQNPFARSYCSNLYTMTIWYGLMEEGDELRFFGTKFYETPELIDYFFDSKTVQPLLAHSLDQTKRNISMFKYAHNEPKFYHFKLEDLDGLI